MNEQASGRTIGDYAGLLRRRWRYLVTIAPAVILLAIFIAYALPVSYQSSGSIILEPSSLPEKMVPTTVTGSSDVVQYAGQQLELIRRRVMTDDTLLEIVQQIDPYPDEKDASARQKASMIARDTSVEPVDPVTFEPAENSTAFMLRYVNSDPKVAQTVTNKLLDLFLTYNRRTRAEQATAALKFLQVQASSLEGDMEGMEKRLAQFKARYGEALPEGQGRNLAGMDRAQREVETADAAVRDAQQREDLLELQLNEISPSLTAAVGDWRAELARLKSELALAQQKYTPEHPDVKRLQRAVADLAAQGGASNAASRGAPDNPDYLRVRSQLNAVRAELSGAQAQAARARRDLAKFSGNIATAPNVEREYLRLQREYDNARDRYQDLQAKIKAAALAENLEGEARGERFSLMKAPNLPSAPASPNRLGIMLIGFLLGAGLAILAAVFVDASDPTVRSSEDLSDILGSSTPIGTVPFIPNAADWRRRKRVWGTVAAAYGLATVVVALQVFLD
jgi:polysaccharide biosynthesis transport protein